MLDYILAILSGALMFSYVGWTTWKFGIPVSISRTYYKIPWKPLFTIVLVLAGFMMLPRSFDIVPSDLKIVPFLGVMGMIVVGTSPDLENDIECRIHWAGAIASVVFSQLWVILYTNVQLSLLLWIIPASILGWTIVKDRPKGLSELDKCLDTRKFTFWTELICYIILYIGLLV